MADAHKDEVKKDAPAEVDFSHLFKVLGWAISGFVVLAICLYVVLFNEESALNFIKFLNLLQVLLGLFSVYMIYKFYNYTVDYKVWGSKTWAWYVGRYKPEKINDAPLTSNQSRLEKAKMHINSPYKEEWKIGVIELDNILRDLLKEAGYKGETIAELLKDAESKGFKSVDDAWEAHKFRNKIVHEGVKYDFPKETAALVLRKYSVAFQELKI